LGFPPYGLLSLASYWAFFLMGFGYRFAKMSINIQPHEHVGCVTTHMQMLSLLSFMGLLFQSLPFLGKLFSFFWQI